MKLAYGLIHLIHYLFACYENRLQIVFEIFDERHIIVADFFYYETEGEESVF